MTELNERIRDFIETGASPVSAQEILTAHVSMHVMTISHQVRPRSRRRLWVLGVAAALIIALLSIGLVSVPGVKNNAVSPASAATLLGSMAAKASRENPLVPGPGQYLYVATIVSNTDGESMHPSPKMFWYNSDELHQVWTSPTAAAHQTYEIVGRPEFVSAADRSVWVTDGSQPLQSGSSGYGPPLYYNVEGLPTKASEILAYLKSQTYLPKESPYGSQASWEFDTALQFLENGASSLQRAAILKFMATIPGVRLSGYATSIVTHEKGSVIELPFKRSGLTTEAVFNPSNSNLIEIRYVYISLASIEAPFPGPTRIVGEIQSYSDFAFAGITQAKSDYSLPPGTPTFPKVWPFGSTREPLSGWLGSSSKH